jgi:hypothetical protein
MGKQSVEKPRGLGLGYSAMVHLRLGRQTAKVDHGRFFAPVSCTVAQHHMSLPKIREGQLFFFFFSK